MWKVWAAGKCSQHAHNNFRNEFYANNEKPGDGAFKVGKDHEN